MSKHARGSADPKLAYMIHDWQRTTGGTSATEDDAEAIVAWLRSRKGSEYARKPADGLRKQVAHALKRMGEGRVDGTHNHATPTPSSASPRAARASPGASAGASPGASPMAADASAMAGGAPQSGAALADASAADPPQPTSIEPTLGAQVPASGGAGWSINVTPSPSSLLPRLPHQPKSGTPVATASGWQGLKRAHQGEAETRKSPRPSVVEVKCNNLLNASIVATYAPEGAAPSGGGAGGGQGRGARRRSRAHLSSPRRRHQLVALPAEARPHAHATRRAGAARGVLTTGALTRGALTRGVSTRAAHPSPRSGSLGTPIWVVWRVYCRR